jgi:GNAT superfamily N-acetyltransferase
MNYTLKTGYWKEPAAKAAFKRFAIDIFGLDFAAWDKAGFWDDAFTAFSYFDGDEVVASTCLYLLPAIIDGRVTKLAQISTVGTRAELRGQGLNRQLTDIAMDWANGKHEGVFLFSDEEAGPFYERIGFSPQKEFLEVIDAAGVTARKGAVKLNIDIDLAKIHDYAKNRAPISNKLSIGNEKLSMFHVLYVLRDVIFEIPELKCLVACKRSEGRLKVFDILGEEIPSWSELQPFIAGAADKEVEFHFHTDKLGIDPVRQIPLLGNLPFVRGVFPVKKPVFPFTCRA